MRFFLIFIIVQYFLFAQKPSKNELESELDPTLKKIVKNPDGTEFWVCFMRNHTDPPRPDNENRLILQLFITSDYDCKVKIEIKGLNYSQEIEIPKGTVRNVEINPLAQIKTSEVIEKNRAVHISSDKPINVYGLNRRKLTTDTFLALPIDVLGKEYMAIGYDIAIQLTSQFAVIATQDSTEVSIFPSVTTAKGKRPGEEIKIMLDKGDVYQVASAPRATAKNKADLTGSIIYSNKKIAFFSGHQCAYVPENTHACNHLVEQLPPIKAWGRHYYIGRQNKRSKYNYRVLASENNTKIFENYKLLTTLKKGQFLERQATDDVQLTANHPVLVSQYSQGFRNGDSIGDPMMLLISPTQQFLKKYRFATPVTGFWEHFVNLVAPTSSLDELRLDGNPIPKNKFKPFGTSRYSIAYLKVKYGTHELEGSEPFGMSSYGFGFDKDDYDAYGNIGGQSFLEYEPADDTLAPTAEIRKLDNGYNVLVRDDRVNDRGLKEVNVLMASNFNFLQPDLEPSTPQIAMNLNIADNNKFGSIVFEATDVADNKSVFTVCYNLDPKTGTFRYYLNEGESECELEANFSFALFSKNAYMNHSSDFSESGELATQGKFADASSFNFGFGGMFSYGILPKMNISARFFADKFSGQLSAPDSITSQIRNGLELVPLQEATDLEIDSWNINIAISADYYFNSRFYILGGFRMNLMIGNSVNAQRRILSPAFANYSNETKIEPFEADDGSSLNELESLSSIGFGGFAGVGVSERIYKDLSIFAEMNFDYQFTSIISDDDWQLWQFYINLGVKYPL